MKIYSPVLIANFECNYNDGNKVLKLNYHVRAAPEPGWLAPLAPLVPLAPKVAAAPDPKFRKYDWGNREYKGP
jgi:hypothetical protein